MGHELCWMGAARACLIWEVVLGPVRRIYNVGKELVTPGLKQGWGRQVPSSGTLQVCYRAYHTMCRAWTRPEVRGRVVWVTESSSNCGLLPTSAASRFSQGWVFGESEDRNKLVTSRLISQGTYSVVAKNR